MRHAVAGVLLLCVCGLSLWGTGAQARIQSVDGVTHFEDKIAWGGRTRNALYFRPSASSNTLRPLVIVLHYRGGNAEDMAALTRVGWLARDFGAWVVLPEGVRGRWNNDPGADTGVDDVGFLARLMDSAASRFPIDKKRIYLVGYSSGGFMATRFACERPYRIAAVAAVAWSFTKAMNQACQPSAGTPIAMINGTQDTRVKYEDAGMGMLNVPASARRWAQINGCPTAPKHALLPDLAPKDNTRVETDTWSSCTAGEVRLYTVDRGGHTWPDSDVNCMLCGRTTYDIDGTLVAWNFLRRFSR